MYRYLPLPYKNTARVVGLPTPYTYQIRLITNRIETTPKSASFCCLSSVTCSSSSAIITAPSSMISCFVDLFVMFMINVINECGGIVLHNQTITLLLGGSVY